LDVCSKFSYFFVQLVLRYEINGQVHGVVVVYLKPHRTPSAAFKDVLIDDEEVTNFTPGIVASFVCEGLRHSVADRCVEEVDWEVEEVVPEGHMMHIADPWANLTKANG
jgi:hypothetical protein